MAGISVNKLTNANVYINGSSFLGKCEEINLPTVMSKMSEHKAVGMVGSFELFSGIDKLEARFKWNSFYSDVLKLAANPVNAVNLQVRSSLDVWGAGGRQEQQPVVIHMTGTFKGLPLGNFKQHENVEAETPFNVTYVKMVINGETIMELDVLANIFIVDGVDIMAQYRANIGG